AGSTRGAATRQLKVSDVMKIKANGITINYQLDGPDGAPWLVLSNSLATNLSMWDEQARELGRGFRVLRYDQRGHGGTEASRGRFCFWLARKTPLQRPCASSTRRCPARATSSLPPLGTFPISTSRGHSPARLPISWPANEGAAARACRSVDCKLAGRHYTLHPRSTPAGRRQAN